jgi:hypothetical protein
VEAINQNKLKVNGASCWAYYTDILSGTANKTQKIIQRPLSHISKDGPFLFFFSL